MRRGHTTTALAVVLLVVVYHQAYLAMPAPLYHMGEAHHNPLQLPVVQVAPVVALEQVELAVSQLLWVLTRPLPQALLPPVATVAVAVV